MTTEEKKQVAEVLNERPKRVRIGWLWFLARPLTLGQIYELGEATNEITIDDLNNVSNQRMVLSAIIDHYKDAKALQKAFLVCLFRKRWKRRLFGRYIKRRLTVSHLQTLLTHVALSFNVNFFLTSIIFLRRTTIMTEPNPTTAHGLPSEE